MKVNNLKAVPANPVDMEGAHRCTVLLVVGPIGRNADVCHARV